MEKQKKLNKEFEVLYNLYGATMQSSLIQFGDFTVYNIRESTNELISKYPYLKNDERLFNNVHTKLIIGIKVKAVENKIAVDIADKLCESFENVFSYALSDLTHLHRISIFNFWGSTSIPSIKIACGDNSWGAYMKKERIKLTNLEDSFFQNANGNDKIWKLITKKNKNEIEARLLNAIEWIGKASYDLDRSKSLIQFVFAMEGMLQFNEGEFITPSITSQLSDWIAFIIHDDKEERKKISKYFKEIYRKRSAIAHGGANVVEMEELTTARDIARLMVITFLNTKPFNEMTSMEQLKKHMDDLKFQ